MASMEPSKEEVDLVIEVCYLNPIHDRDLAIQALKVSSKLHLSQSVLATDMHLLDSSTIATLKRSSSNSSLTTKKYECLCPKALLTC